MLQHPEYKLLKQNFMHGWRTWNVRSVLSHVHMPDGLALNIGLKEYRGGAYLKETLIGRFPTSKTHNDNETAYPGMHAYDDSYTEMRVTWQDFDFKVESTVDDGELILLVTPAQLQPYPAMLTLECGYLWNRPGWVEHSANGLVAHGPDGDIEIRTTGAPAPFDANIPTQSPFIAVAFDGPIAFYTGAERTLAQMQSLIAQRRTALEAQYAKYGELSGMYSAMECAIAWDTIYDAQNDRVISPVSRLWSIGSGGYVLFCWDNYFAGFMAGWGNREIAYSNLIEITSEHTAKGFVPNFIHGTHLKSEDRSQPPVGSAMVLETYRRYREKWLVEALYPQLMEWNGWFYAHRSSDSGALCWGSDPVVDERGNVWESNGVNDTFGGALESGLDNSPMYDDIPFDHEKHMMKLEDVGLTGLYIMDCRALRQLAQLLGREADARELLARQQRAEQGLEGLWDEQQGFYYNRRTDTGEFSRRISPTNFYALFSEQIPESRLRRIADEHYYNPDEFYGPWMLPSIARNDPAYADQNYWRGRVWAPLNFLVYMALQGHDLPDVQADLAEKSKAIFLKEWNEHRHVHENYNSITGEGCDAHNSDKFYHWGALMSAIALIQAGYMDGFCKPL